jgi:hypothetical protein
VRGKANAKFRLPQSTEQMKCRDEVQERKIEGVEDFERKELAPQTYCYSRLRTCRRTNSAVSP